MKIAARLMLSLAAAGAFAVPAAAQQQSEQSRTWGQPVDPVAAQAIRNFALCAVQRTPAGAERLLGMDFRNDDYGAAVQRYATGHDYCGRGTLRFSSVLFAGGLAEGLLRRMGNAGQSLSPAASPATPFEARDETEYVGLCVARTAPAEVRALLRTEPASPEERAAVAALSPALTACVRQGQTMRLNRPGLRAIVALATYRIARNMASPSTATRN